MARGRLYQITTKLKGKGKHHAKTDVIFKTAFSYGGHPKYRGKLRLRSQLIRVNSHPPIPGGQNSHSNHVIQPAVRSTARSLEDNTKVKLPGGLGWATCADEDVGAIVCLEVIACIGREDSIIAN